MIANAPYIETFDFECFDCQIIKECPETSDINDFADEPVYFLNAQGKSHRMRSAEEIIQKEQIIHSRLSDIETVRSFVKQNPEAFTSTEQFVLNSFDEARNGLMQMSLDYYRVSLSTEDECLFIYARKNDSKFFFNLFFENNTVEALVNISQPDKRFTFEGSIGESLQQLFELFQSEFLYA